MTDDVEAHGNEVRDALDPRRRYEIGLRCNNDYRKGKQLAHIYHKVFKSTEENEARRMAFAHAEEHHGDIYSCVSIISCVEVQHQ